jgi:peptide/nickel transport system substrate-binding protein
VGQEYVLDSYPKYWRGAPHFTTVRIPIVANFSTQSLELQNGQINMLLSNVPKSSAESLGSEGFQVENLPSTNKAVLLSNPNTGVFKDKAVREALYEAIDRKTLVDSVFGSAATVSTQVYPEGTFPANLAPDNPPLEPAKLKSLVANLPDKSVTLEYPAEGGAVTSRMAEELQVQLQSSGLDITLRATPFSELFTLAEHPSRRPDLLVLIAPPDTANPDAWIRLLAYSSSPVNYLGCVQPGLDAAIDAGLNSETEKEAIANYAKAAGLVTESACSLGLANVDDTIVAQPGVTGISHTLALPGVVDLGELGAE